MSNNTEQLVDQLSSMTVLEMAELKKALEERWGVTAAAPVAVAAPGAAAAGEASVAAEATDFSITVEEIDSAKKIAALKVVRKITGLGLKEAKEFIESTPKVLKESAPKAEAEEIKKELEDAGVKVSLKGV